MMQQENWPKMISAVSIIMKNPEATRFIIQKRFHVVLKLLQWVKNLVPEFQPQHPQSGGSY